MLNNPNFELGYSMAELKVPSSPIKRGAIQRKGNIHSGLAKSRPRKFVRKKGEVEGL